jgi:outer membrane lipoprotein-sorting protein
VAVCATVGTVAPLRSADLFDEITRKAGPIEKTLQAVSASFTETTTSTLLRTPQVAKGTVVARRPGRVRLTYVGDGARTVTIDGSTMRLEWPARGIRETRDIGRMMKRASRFFEDGSTTELRKHFDIVAVVATDRPDSWHVTFTPKRAQMREGVERVHLWIDQTSLLLTVMKLDYPGGDTRVMEFTDVRINPPLPAE